MDKKLLTQAASGDTAALATLRQQTPPNLTVFVAPGGKLDITATLAAFEYWQIYQTPPDEWGDEPTVNFAQAFPAKVRRDPINLKPITPGLWTKLWESKDGHGVIAAIWYGIRRGHIHESELELRGRVRRHLESPDQLLVDVLHEMKRDERQMRAAMDVVNAPVEQIVPIILITSREQASIAVAPRINASDLHDVLSKHFSIGELRTMIFNLGGDGDDFSNRRNVCARELVEWAQRHDRLNALSDMAHKMNPARW